MMKTATDTVDRLRSELQFFRRSLRLRAQFKEPINPTYVITQINELLAELDAEERPELPPEYSRIDGFKPVDDEPHVDIYA